MSAELNVLLITSASIGLIHTLTGPDHYLPFIVMSKARHWSMTKTLWITFVCGLGHVGSSIVIGAIGIVFGIGIHKIKVLEAFRGDIAAWAFIIFGLVYFIWGLWKAFRHHTHKHFHYDEGTLQIHKHIPQSDQGHSHGHFQDKKVNLTPWILFTVFVLGPCEPLIPLLMYPAATTNITAVIWVSIVFAITTIGAMMSVVLLSMHGFRFIPMKFFEKYIHAFAGATICLSGCAIVFLGL